MIMVAQFWKFIRVRYEKQWRIDSRSNSILHDIIKGIRVVKSFGNEEREIKKFADTCRRLAEISSSNEKLWARTFPIINFFVGVGEFFVLYVGGRMVLGRSFTLGELMQFSLYLRTSTSRCAEASCRDGLNAMTSMVKILEILTKSLKSATQKTNKA